MQHAEALAAALERAGRRYDLTIYADEGHRYARPQNVVDCRAQCLEFLLTNLSVRAAARRWLTGPRLVVDRNGERSARTVDARTPA